MKTASEKIKKYEELIDKECGEFLKKCNEYIFKIYESETKSTEGRKSKLLLLELLANRMDMMAVSCEAKMRLCFMRDDVSEEKKHEEGKIKKLRSKINRAKMISIKTKQSALRLLEEIYKIGKIETIEEIEFTRSGNIQIHFHIKKSGVVSWSITSPEVSFPGCLVREYWQDEDSGLKARNFRNYELLIARLAESE